ncbi:MAG: hypothetical protein Pg6C_14400 [Treponemataceae bacterium]|nr:MAG: hypothetical protein Pg6C_14400 [Treponemataceae bacterium]
MKAKTPLALGVTLLIALSAAAESFRVRSLVILPLEQEGTVYLTLNDALAVTLPDDRTFLKGVTFDLDIPVELSSFAGAAAYSFYGHIVPSPSQTVISYKGDKLILEALPARTGLSLGVPYGDAAALKASPYLRVLPFVAEEKDSVIFFRIQLVMKGVPDNVLAARVRVTARPVYEDKGRLTLKVIFPRDNAGAVIEKPYTVFIDERAVGMTGAGAVLDAGLHHLSIISDFYRNETRVITIPKAKTLPLEIALTDIAPLVMIAVPEGADIFFDGEKIDSARKSFTVQPGAHLVKFALGGYEISRSIHAVNGKTYSVSLDFDIEISETP